MPGVKSVYAVTVMICFLLEPASFGGTRDLRCHFDFLKTIFARKPTPPLNLHSPLLDWIDTHGLGSSEVKNLFIRIPGAPVYEMHYIKNAVDSIKTEFAPWFEGHSQQSYLKMLESQHKTLAMGLDRKSLYRPPSSGRPLKLRPASKLRAEKIWDSSPASTGFHAESLCKNYWCPEGFFDHLKRAQETSPHRLELEGIPFESRPQGFYGWHPKWNFTFDMVYVPPGLSKPYLERMEKLMLQLREITPGAPKEEWMPLLADYVQLFSVSLPFDRINFSQAMMHANYILMRQGMKGISHGALDYFAMTYSSHDYRKIFETAVMRAQLKP